MKKSLYVFGILDELDIDWFLAVGQIASFSPGEHLIRGGEFPLSLILLIEGRCDILIENPQRCLINRCGAGELLGELSFVDGLPATASVIATEPCRALCIERETLRQRLHTESGFASRFYHSIAYFLADRLRATMLRESLKFAVDRSKDDQDAADEISMSLMDNASIAANRYQHFLRRLQTR